MNPVRVGAQLFVNRHDTPEQIAAMADKIMTRAVRTKTMPQGNKTGMTDEERTILKRWILQGAKIQ